MQMEKSRLLDYVIPITQAIFSSFPSVYSLQSSILLSLQRVREHNLRHNQAIFYTLEEATTRTKEDMESFHLTLSP